MNPKKISYKSMKERQTGHYWINFSGVIEVGYYDSMIRTWHLIGTNKVYYDKDFKFIDTKRLHHDG